MFFFSSAAAQLEPSSPVLMFVGHTELNARTWYDPTERVISRYLHNTQKRERQTSMTSAGFELAISAVRRLQTCALDGTTTGVGPAVFFLSFFHRLISVYLLYCKDRGLSHLVTVNDTRTHTHTHTHSV